MNSGVYFMCHYLAAVIPCKRIKCDFFDKKKQQQCVNLAQGHRYLDIAHTFSDENTPQLHMNSYLIWFAWLKQKHKHYFTSCLHSEVLEQQLCVVQHEKQRLVM